MSDFETRVQRKLHLLRSIKEWNELAHSRRDTGQFGGSLEHAGHHLRAARDSLSHARGSAGSRKQSYREAATTAVGHARRSLPTAHPAQEHLQTALDALQRGDYDAADGLFDTVQQALQPQEATANA
jgi:hypothetical protein